jgi:hypothetical protein
MDKDFLTKRAGAFTSSEIYKLVARHKKTGEYLVSRDSYINKVFMELQYNCPMSSYGDSRPTIWGKLLEKWYMAQIELGTPTPTDTLTHPECPLWKGTPDMIYKQEKMVGDLKCPSDLERFAIAYECKGDIDKLRATYKEGEKYYWQLMSNAVLTGSDKCKLVFYVPSEADIEEPKTGIRAYSDDGEGKHHWVLFSNYYELPHVPKESSLPNQVVIEWQVDKIERQQLINDVLSAADEVTSKLFPKKDNG